MKYKSASALLSPDGQMFFGKKSPPFDFYCRRLFDPEGLGAEAGQFSKPRLLHFTYEMEKSGPLPGPLLIITS
jgi:hypothetical protein